MKPHQKTANPVFFLFHVCGILGTIAECVLVDNKVSRNFMAKNTNGKNKKSYGASTDDIMDFLEHHMVMREDFDAVKSDVSVLKSDVSVLKTVVVDLDKRLTRVEATMVTKSYLDDKLADLKGDLIEKMRKQESKINTLIDLLAKRSVLKKEDVILFKKEFQLFPSI